MSYQSDMVAALAASSLTNVVGDRIYADVADGTAHPPYVVWQVVSTGGDNSHDGGREVEFPLIQFSCWATSKAAAIALASSLNAILDGKTIPGDSKASFRFSNQFGTYDPETKLFGEIIEYQAACQTNT